MIEMKPMTAFFVGVIVMAIILTLLAGPVLGPICAIIGGILGWFQVRHFIKDPIGPRSTKYDDADYHDPDGNREEEFAAGHIALFLRWCDQRGLIFEFLNEESGAELAKARAGAITYTEFLLSQCDGKLLDEFLSEEGNRFAAAYYDRYLEDFRAISGFPAYSRTELEHDYAAISTFLDRRLAEFQAGTLTLPRKKSPRWRFGSKA